MPTWRFVGSCFDGAPFAIAGIDVWRSWSPTGERTVVTDPLYPWQTHEFPIYTMSDNGRTVVFAAGEVSNTVWAFFIPDPE